MYQQQDGELLQTACADDVEQDYSLPTLALQAHLQRAGGGFMPTMAGWGKSRSPCT
jgi:hypothetical protein